MHSGELMEALGLKPGGHLPSLGMLPRKVQGVTVYVRPEDPWRRKTRAGMQHRVMVICPDCGRHISAGRFAQHLPGYFGGKGGTHG